VASFGLIGSSELTYCNTNLIPVLLCMLMCPLVSRPLGKNERSNLSMGNTHPRLIHSRDGKGIPSPNDICCVRKRWEGGMWRRDQVTRL
jgi:hypothetical protein